MQQGKGSTRTRWKGPSGCNGHSQRWPGWTSMQGHQRAEGQPQHLDVNWDTSTLPKKLRKPELEPSMAPHCPLAQPPATPPAASVTPASVSEWSTAFQRRDASQGASKPVNDSDSTGLQTRSNNPALPLAIHSLPPRPRSALPTVLSEEPVQMASGSLGPSGPAPHAQVSTPPQAHPLPLQSMPGPTKLHADS
ncbi:PREDICTED: actin cytoskeleton-regulatory complex protein pan1-like [Chinchilla lanigera]|uniref:actin cytoskeleton-regulatory complex protein pan1-like n=1 Tax=Chinchilla lanigera TaxID=34839 RepID=UPI00038F19DC|nr:PREDICTED: actin cytoskeleton-regulatory complex protein pan1-like [Chinchilla lanigera]